MRKHRAWVALIVTIALVPFLPARVGAVPPLPSTFYGTVQGGGEDAPAGTTVSAWIDGVKYAETTTFTSAGASWYTLNVLGNDESTPQKDGGVEGDTIVFKVADQTADQTGTWHEGTSVRLDLTVPDVIPGPPPPCYDFNEDGQVDVADIQLVVDRWRLTALNPDPDNNPSTPNYEARFDADSDGIITVKDIMRVASAWGPCP